MEMTWKVQGEDLFVGVSGKLDTMSAMDYVMVSGLLKNRDRRALAARA